MESEQSKNFIVEAWKVFKTRNAHSISELFADDAEWIAQGNATAVALDADDHMIGKDAIAEFLSCGMYRLFQDVEIDFRCIVASGDIVVVEERVFATIPNGRRYENDYCFIFVLENGRIRQVREYMDTLKGHKAIFA